MHKETNIQFHFVANSWTYIYRLASFPYVSFRSYIIYIKRGEPGEEVKLSVVV